MKLFENLRTKKAGDKTVSHDDEISAIMNSAALQELMDFITSIKKSEKDRKQLKEEYEQMSKDPIIGAAVELIADDATQEDATRGKIFWVVPTEDNQDTEMIDELNEALDAMGVDEKAWSYAWNLLVYGGVMLDTHYEELANGKKIDEHIAGKLGLLFEMVENYYSVADLQKFGDTVSYGIGEDKEYTLYNTKQFIHFINDRGVNREKTELIINKGQSTEKKEEFKIRYGTSYLETAREAFKILDLLEYLLLVVRFGKSSLYRIFKIEVGGATKIETSRILREFKTKLSQSEAMDKNAGYNSAKKPIPYGQNVYIPVRNGKGDVSHEIVGGDVEIKDIIDIEYFRNKLFAALKIPKAYLGFEEEMPGGLGNQSLTRIDIRYARTVKRVKQCLKAGVKDMLDFYCDTHGHSDWKEYFEVRTSKISTADESDKRDEIMTDIGMAESLKTLLSEAEPNPKKLAEVLTKKVLKLDDLWDAIFGKEGVNEDETS